MYATTDVQIGGLLKFKVVEGRLFHSDRFLTYDR